MDLITPFWFKQRQCKAELPDDAGMVKVTGPNLGEAYLHVEPGQSWRVGLRRDPAGPDIATAVAEQPNARSAWEAAFELYRTHFIA